MLQQNPGGQETKSGQREEACLMAPRGPLTICHWDGNHRKMLIPQFFFSNDLNGFSNPEGLRRTPETALATIHV